MTLPNPKVLQPGCTATTNRNQACEMLLHEGVEALQEGRAQVHAAPGRWAEVQG